MRDLDGRLKLTGPFVRCRPIERDVVDGLRIYVAGPRQYFIDGEQVTPAAFWAHVGGEPERV
jgi:hypothetical protein